jgi:uroporphyrinogen-III synthase
MSFSGHCSTDLLVVQTQPGADATRGLAETSGLRAEVLVPLVPGPPKDPEPLARAAENLASYDALIFGSVRAAEGLAQAMRARGVEPYAGPVYSVGAETRARTSERGALRAAFSGSLRMGSQARAEGLFDALARDFEPLTRRRFLFARAPEGRTWLMDRLIEAGAYVDAPDAYRLRPADLDPAVVAAQVGRSWAVAALSGEGLAQAVKAHPRGAAGFGDVELFVIGPVAKARAEALGLAVAGVSPRAERRALVELVRDRRFGRPPGPGVRA